jgi:hypothetical protein
MEVHQMCKELDQDNFLCGEDTNNCYFEGDRSSHACGGEENNVVEEHSNEWQLDE